MAVWLCAPLLVTSPFQALAGQGDRPGLAAARSNALSSSALAVPHNAVAPFPDTISQSATNCSAASLTQRDAEGEPGHRHNALVGTPLVADRHLLKRCLIDVTTVQELKASDQITIVDMRSPSAYNAYRIPGSINIPAYALKTKTFLKLRHLVLVNEGRSHRELLQACQQHQGAGFSKVAVMKGGLGAWHAQGGVLAGNDRAAEALSRISAREFFAAQNERRWVVLDATSETVSSWSDFGSPTVVPYTTDSELVATLKSLPVDGESPALGSAILVVTTRGEGLARIRAFLISQGIRNAYFLERGLKGYQDYLATRRSLLARVQRGPTPVARCGGS